MILPDGRTNGRTDGRTDGLTDGRTDGRTNRGFKGVRFFLSLRLDIMNKLERTVIWEENSLQISFVFQTQWTNAISAGKVGIFLTTILFTEKLSQTTEVIKFEKHIIISLWWSTFFWNRRRRKNGRVSTGILHINMLIKDEALANHSYPNLPSPDH